MPDEPGPEASDPLHRHSPYGRLVGTRILAVDPLTRRIEIEYEARPEFTNRIGNVAGGMIASFLDSVTGLAAQGVLPADRVAVHTKLCVEYHRPVHVGRVLGRGHVIEIGERDIEAEGELLDGEGTLLASARATLRIIRKPVS